MTGNRYSNETLFAMDARVKPATATSASAAANGRGSRFYAVQCFAL
jgi:hypothetical protein